VDFGLHISFSSRYISPLFIPPAVGVYHPPLGETSCQTKRICLSGARNGAHHCFIKSIVVWTGFTGTVDRFQCLKPWLFPNLVRYLWPPLWSSGQFLATDPRVQGSIPGHTRFSEK
jgi:hypothetical protein